MKNLFTLIAILSINLIFSQNFKVTSKKTTNNQTYIKQSNNVCSKFSFRRRFCSRY